jgi:hypothetical protein
MTTKLQWSGIRESNPRLDLGKVAYYHYTNPALRKASASVLFIAWRLRADKARRRGLDDAINEPSSRRCNHWPRAPRVANAANLLP